MTEGVMGRPPKYNTTEEMQVLIDLYFESCTDEREITRINPDGDSETYMERYQVRPVTMSGLALALDLSRAGLIHYSKKDKFFITIKRARNRVINFIEEGGMGTKSPSFYIFSMKNLGEESLKDKHEIESTNNNTNTNVITSKEEYEAELKRINAEKEKDESEDNKEDAEPS